MDKLRLKKILKNFTGIEINDDLKSTICVDNQEHFLLKKYSGLEVILNTFHINELNDINTYLRKLNNSLKNDGIVIFPASIIKYRKALFYKKNPKILASLFYFFDYILFRVFPKIKLFSFFYYLFFNSRPKLLSKAEIFGRFYFCGFEFLNEYQSDEFCLFIFKKKLLPQPYLAEKNPIIISLNRVGYKGKNIKVFKFRTMFLYSRYIQKFIIEKNNLNDAGKVDSDFRINTLGKFLRKYWLDEIPMLFNLLKCQIKLVGVRPISKQFLELYPQKLKKYRQNFKPGFIPPLYADLPKTFEEILNSEMNYLQSYEKSPFKTDIKYFFKSIFNVFFRGIRSG